MKVFSSSFTFTLWKTGAGPLWYISYQICFTWQLSRLKLFLRSPKVILAYHYTWMLLNISRNLASFWFSTLYRLKSNWNSLYAHMSQCDYISTLKDQCKRFTRVYYIAKDHTKCHNQMHALKEMYTQMHINVQAEIFCFVVLMETNKTNGME